MMPDREKVIRGLECHAEPHFGMEECFCETCPYDELTCGLDVPNDALKLLKAQEPMEPKREVSTQHGQILKCGECGTWFVAQKQKFCHECGRGVKWDA